MDTLSYISVPRLKPYRYYTIIDVLRENMEKDPDKDIAVHRESGAFRKVLTNRDLDSRATKLAKFLIQNGVKRGDRVAIFGPNTLEWIIAEVAILMAGAVSFHVTINVKDTSVVQKMLSKVQCRAFVFDSGVHNELKDIISSLLADFPPKTENTDQPIVIFLRSFMDNTSCVNYSEIMEKEEVHAELPTIYPEDTAVIFPTSGSTGEPKLIKHSHFGFANAFDAADFATEYAIYYSDRPFSWVGGYPLYFINAGLTLVFTNTFSLRPGSTDAILDIIRSENCQMALLLPYFLIDLIENKTEYQNEKPCIDTILTGGQIVDENHAQVVGTFCKRLMNGYGCSETLGISFAQFSETGNVGTPLPGTEIKIIGDAGQPVKKGTVGKIYLRDLFLFQGYFKDEQLTSEVLSRDGWFDTGDIGLITIKNELVVKGRTKEIISRGTRKIVPTPIEEIIQKMPHIKYVAVVAVPDRRLLEEICVCYVPHSLETISPQDVENYCKSKFVAEQSYDGLGDMPRYFLRFSEFPMLMTGKPDKKKITHQAVCKLNLD